jgi:hypothetical protein
MQFRKFTTNFFERSVLERFAGEIGSVDAANHAVRDVETLTAPRGDENCPNPM